MTNRMRSTKSRRNSRRGHHGISAIDVQNNSDGLSLRHMASLNKGKYKGRDVLNITKKVSKKESKSQNADEGEKKTKEIVNTPELDLSLDTK